MKIGAIGSSGLVGSRFVELLSNSYSFSEFNSSTGTDITKADTLSQIENDQEISHVILFAAKTDVDGCELDRDLGEEGEAWELNVLGVENVVNICKNAGKKLIYVSTDFVFDGTKPDGESYSENESPNPLNWYGFTKLKGEEVIASSGVDYVIARLAYPYRSTFDKKNDFVRAIRKRLESGQPVTVVEDHVFNPTFIDDFVNAVDILVQQNLSGIYHVVGSESLNPYTAAQKIAEIFELDSALITPTTRAEYFAGKAERPFNLSLNNDKIKALGARMKTFDEGLREVKRQLTS